MSLQWRYKGDCSIYGLGRSNLVWQSAARLLHNWFVDLYIIPTLCAREILFLIK